MPVAILHFGIRITLCLLYATINYCNFNELCAFVLCVAPINIFELCRLLEDHNRIRDWFRKKNYGKDLWRCGFFRVRSFEK